MARLYNGWGGLGALIQNTQGRIHDRNRGILDQFGQTAMDYAKEQQAKADEDKRREQAMKFASASGVPTEQAQFLAGMSPEAIYQHALNLEAEKRRNTRSDFEYGRSRDDKKADHTQSREEQLADEDRQREYARADREEERTYKEGRDDKGRKDAIASAEYNQLNARLMALQSKAQVGLADERDIAELKEVKAQYADWLKKHPDYTAMDFGSTDPNAPQPITRQAIERALLGLIDENDLVDPVALKDYREGLLKDHGIDLDSAEEVKALYNLVKKKQKGSKTARGAANNGAQGEITDTDLKNQEAIRLEKARLRKIEESINQWANGGGKYKKPAVDESDLKKLSAKAQNIYRNYK